MQKLYLFLIIIFGFILRVSFLDKGVIWYDEIGSIAVAKQAFPFGILDKLYHDDYHAPLYYFILHFWMKLFGDSEVVLRFLSAVTGTLVIPVMYLAGKELKDHKTGLLAAFLVCFHPFLLLYSQEIRHYSLGLLWVSFSVLFLIRAYKSDSVKNYAMIAFANLLILYTMSILGVIFVAVEILLFLPITKSKKKFIISQITGLIFSLPYLPFVYHHISTIASGFANPLWWNKFDIMDVFININNFFSYCYIYSSTDNFQHLLALSFIAVGSFAFLFYFSSIFKALKDNNAVITLIFCTAAGFYLVQIILAYFDKFSLVSKYTIFVCPLLILIAAYGFFQCKTKRLFVLLIIFSTINIYIQLFTDDFSTIKKTREDTHIKYFQTLKYYGFTPNDLVIMDWGGRFFSEYFHGKELNILAGFDLEKALSYNDSRLNNLIFDENILNGLNKTNAHQKFKNYLVSDSVSPKFEDYVKTSIIDKLDTGEKASIFIWYNYSEKDIFNITQNKELYPESYLVPLISNKTMYNMVKICDKYLKRIPPEKEEYYKIYLWEKI